MSRRVHKMWNSLEDSYLRELASSMKRRMQEMEQQWLKPEW